MNELRSLQRGKETLIYYQYILLYVFPKPKFTRHIKQNPESPEQTNKNTVYFKIQEKTKTENKVPTLLQKLPYNKLYIDIMYMKLHVTLYRKKEHHKYGINIPI